MKMRHQNVVSIQHQVNGETVSWLTAVMGLVISSSSSLSNYVSENIPL